MAAFEYDEYADILFCYGLCSGNAAAARRTYVERFPNRRVPNVRVFSTTFRRIRESGRVDRRRGDSGRPRLYAPEEEEEILTLFQNDPSISTRAAARRLGLSQWKVWFTVHTARLHPFHYTPVQALEEGDPVRRMEFCRFMINADMEDRNFFSRILWTDESKFARDGINNFHNTHYWAPKGENPRMKKERAHQTRFSLNVWMGIINNNLVGPHFLPQNLNGEMYEHFLREEITGLMEDVPIETRRNMIFQHDGCPAHFRLGVRQWLDQTYPHRWIGRGGPIPWPARCPDLTPCDFYLWGHMKALVYTSPITTVEELRSRIRNAAEEIKTSLTTRIIKTEVRRRLRACIRNRGSHFEQDP